MAIDIWDGIPLFDIEDKDLPLSARTKEAISAQPIRQEATENLPDGLAELSEDENRILIIEDKISIFSKHTFVEDDFMSESLEMSTRKVLENVFETVFPRTPENAYILRYALKNYKSITGVKDSLKTIGSLANEVYQPYAILSEDNKTINIHTMEVYPYKNLVNKLGGYKVKGNYRINSSKGLDLVLMNKNLPKVLPKFKIDKKIIELFAKDLNGFDGYVNSLKDIPLDELNVIKNDQQTWKERKKSAKSTLEKLESFGLSNLYDLLYHLPRKYIDKSQPQEVKDMIADEKTTIIGKIAKVNTGNSFSSKVSKVTFVITTEAGESIESVFWRQHWLAIKFSVGDEVVITGKVSYFMNEKVINGASIEHSDEAAILPIVPIYPQSETRGITTQLILNATREMMQRAGNIELPEYFEKSSFKGMSFSEALMQLHFPESLEKHSLALDALAFYELVYTQIIIKQTDLKIKAKSGIPMDENSENPIQRKVIESLPFNLTGSQIKAVEDMNSKMNSDKPASVLLNADVGAGKTIVAQLSCLRAAESGYQAALIAPNETLAQQLFRTFKKLIDDSGVPVNIEFLPGGLKVKEKKRILEGLFDGSIDIVVGTQAILYDAVEFKNLGFVAFDEQQKFGAEQRSEILDRQSETHAPHFMMQSATPIPRSTAQVFYGEMDIIELTEKPAGRKPIETIWVKKNYQEVIDQYANELWEDIREEAEKGNQTFILTPMVKDSDKADVASVKGTHRKLSEVNLSSLKVGFAHGQMKKDELHQVMSDFREKKYDVLVASTVIEVGVDIPDATRMVIMSADRLGASSLHQIRGRVGRNSKESICYLISDAERESSTRRLQSLVDSNDGFDIAKADLESRGEGMLFGSNQSGKGGMKFASIMTHKDLIDEASRTADAIIDSQYADQALEDAVNTFDYDGVSLK